MAYGEWRRWARYVPVSRAAHNGRGTRRKLVKRGRALRPVVPERAGPGPRHDVLGRAWCDNLRRTPSWPTASSAGAATCATGWVLDLQIGPGTVTALVSGPKSTRSASGSSRCPASRWRRW